VGITRLTEAQFGVQLTISRFAELAKVKTARTDVSTTRLTAPDVNAGTGENGETRSKNRGRASNRPFRVPAPELRAWLDQVIIPILGKEVIGA
jgi:hypothetical protein